MSEMRKRFHFFVKKIPLEMKALGAVSIYNI